MEIFRILRINVVMLIDIKIQIINLDKDKKDFLTCIHFSKNDI